jgi:hypothetical protein
MKQLLALLLCLVLLMGLIPSVLAARPSYGGNTNQSYDVNDPNEQEDNISYVNTTSFGFGGFGQVSRPKTHARSTTDSLLPYNALEKTVAEEPSPVLMFGGKELPVTLEDGGSFTARLGVWDGSDFLPQSENCAVLCLTAETDAAWLVPGSVLRALKNSGIDWLLLQSGDTQSLLPTGPFLSGSRYDTWRQNGLTDGTFLYRVSLAAGSLEMQVSAGEETFAARENDPALAYTGIQTTICRGER